MLGIKYYLKNPRKLVEAICKRRFIGMFISDKLYLKIIWRLRHSTKLDMLNPSTFNEKIQKLKITNRKEEYILYADKLAARKFVSEKIGDKYLIPLLGVWKSSKEIEFDKLPDKFVIKCNHGSGYNIICTDKAILDFQTMQKQLTKWMRTNYYIAGREWVYKRIPRRIFAEKYVIDSVKKDLLDYKFFCFSGEPYIIQVDYDRFTEHKRNFYSLDWEFQDFTVCYPNHPEIQIQKPEKLQEMILVARTLAKGIPFVRIDLYEADKQVYFGEMTFYPGNGHEKISPKAFDKKLSDLLLI